MKKLLCGLLAGAALLWQAQAADLTWQTNVPKALAQAKAEHKLVLLDFTGSDWCHWCKKLDEETFSKPEFATYAETNLVLVQIDFPNHKEQSDELKATNQALQKRFKVEGYPTLLVLNPNATVAWRVDGYLEGGPAALIAKIDGAKK